jgi:protein-disulfide isomerase
MKAIALALPLLALAACGKSEGNSTANAAPVATATPPAGTEWVTTVAATPDGGFVMGNPNAPIKLVEYGSLSCSHCAEFSEKSEKLKNDYVASGKVSYELRNYVRDPMDLAATLLARCGGAGPFFPLTEQMFADQANWFTKVQAMSKEDQQAMAAMSPTQQLAKYANLIGLDEFVRQRGISAEKADACLVNQAETDKLVKMRDRANNEFSLEGTPTFLINGQKVPNAASWEALEPALKAAGA